MQPEKNTTTQVYAGGHHNSSLCTREQPHVLACLAAKLTCVAANLTCAAAVLTHLAAKLICLAAKHALQECRHALQQCRHTLHAAKLICLAAKLTCLRQQCWHAYLGSGGSQLSRGGWGDEGRVHHAPALQLLIQARYSAVPAATPCMQLQPHYHAVTMPATI